MSPILPLDTQRRRSERGENLSNRQSGSATPSSAAPKEFVERSIFLPRRLNMRLDELCDRSGKEPSELIIDAIRLLMSGGVPTAAASIGRQPNHHHQAVALCDVEERPRRHRVRNAHGVESRRCHLGEIPINLVEIVILATVFVGFERPVRDALDVELFRANRQEFPGDAGPLRRGRFASSSDPEAVLESAEPIRPAPTRCVF